jgi:hypothetical protein
MKLLRQSRHGWQYQLHPNEAAILRDLVRKFPFTPPDPARISRGARDARTAEREELLAEALAGHRDELKRRAADLLAAARWKKSSQGQLLTLSGESREILLQILNDIRVGCWHAVGEPETLAKPPPQTKQELVFRHLMDLAGYFESNLLELEDRPD